MGTKINSNYSDLLTFTRASKGHALRPVSYGTELVENGTFDSDASGWATQDLNISVTSVNGEAEVTASSLSTYIYDSFPTKVGGIYKITADGRLGSNVTALNFNIRNNSHTGPYLTASPQLTADGTLEFVFVAEATTTALRLVMFKSATPAVAYWDNISVKEVLFDQPDGTLTLFEHPDNIPRVEYDADGNRLGLLVEEARTNKVTQSQDISSGAWTKTGSFAYADETTAPDGTTTADSMVPSTSSGEHRIQDTITVTSNTETFSVYAKPNGYDFVMLRVQTDSDWNQAAVIFNVKEGTIGSSGSNIDSSSITDAGNGWYRCSITYNNRTGAAVQIHAQEADNGVAGASIFFSGDGTSGIYLWGAQVEEGSFPTSYIKNEGTTNGKDRAADVASIPVADFGYNQSEGTVVVEASMLSSSVGTSSASQAYFGFYKTDQLNRLDAYSDSSSTITIRDRVAGANNDATLSGVTLTDTNKLAVAFESGAKTAAVLNGGSVSETSSTTNNAAYETLILGDTQNVDAELNGHIKSIKYYPRRLTNAQLVQLTS